MYVLNNNEPSFLLCILGETGLTMGLMTSCSQLRRTHQECITKTMNLIARELHIPAQDEQFYLMCHQSASIFEGVYVHVHSLHPSPISERIVTCTQYIHVTVCLLFLFMFSATSSWHERPLNN